ncbi:SIR2 family NAD-dependent protein deacylase [Nitriliruptor alkaliphilus]|uniref:SIR2 family NAD-dependent protein deacylase n=1 Tax=Nitriliruptor alkaliphilus TaxID=427918 RepID=UPI0006972E36|nr:Sir2 family NAD-dependent protein deacetylase [Nitriliruptor alkaliphilus]
MTELLALARAVAATDRLVVLTGAGVSTASGIPDYRGPNGTWTTDPEAEARATIDAYAADEQVRRTTWRRRVDGPVLSAVPNPAHDALVELERRGHLHTVVTQNVDGLHQLAGHAPERVIEVHGNVHGARCLTCGWTGPMATVLARVRRGDPDPRCGACCGVLTSTTVAFGESLDPAVLQRAHDATVSCELFLAVGTSLLVHPVALLPRTALRAGATLGIVTRGPTPYDAEAAIRIDDDAGATLSAVVDLLDDI